MLAVGVCAALALGSGEAGAAGGRRLRSPEIVLAALDSVALLVLVRPGRRGAPETAVTLASFAPFHLAAAAAAGAGSGHHAAFALLAASWTGAALVASRLAPAIAPVLVSLPALALPAAAYALGDFASPGASGTTGSEGVTESAVSWMLRGSPVVGAALLGRRAVEAQAADAIPAVAAAAAVVAAAWAVRSVAPGGARR